MIIECPSCRTRFRLDENRIKGRGARVRCRRCGDSIMVLKPKEPEGIETAGGTLDLRSVVKESLGEGAEPAPSRPSAPRPPETAPPQPPPSRPSDAFPPQPSIGGAQTSAQDEIDLAFERILESSRAEESEKPVDLAVDLGPGEKIGLEPPEEPEKKEIPIVSAPSEFLVSDADTLELLKKEFGEEGPEETEKPLDISGSLRPEAEIPLSPPEVLQTAYPSSVPPLEEEPAPMTSEDFEAQLREVSAAEPEPSPEAPAPEPAAAREPAHPRPPDRREAPAPRFRPSLAVLVLLFLVIAGGGAYLGFTNSGQELLRGMFPGMESLWQRGGKAGPQFDVRNLIGYYEPNAEEGSLFIIKGQVINVGRARKSGIRIHAALLNDKDQAIKETSCYAGNVLPGETLRTARRAEIEKVLTNRFGEQLTNMDVQPGKSVPFMVVFFDPPEEISAYRLEALEGD